MLIKNQIYETVITDYTTEGQGVAHIEGCAVFVPNAVAGERVNLRITLVRKTWAAGKITEILEKSPHRVNRACPVAKLCGGCTFWHMDYAEECRLKAERVKNCLNRIGGENGIGIVDIVENRVVGMKSRGVDHHRHRDQPARPAHRQRGRADGPLPDPA